MVDKVLALTFPAGKSKKNITEVTLVNNTAKYQNVTVPAGKRWLVLQVKQKNIDDVARNCYARVFDVSDEEEGYLYPTQSVAAGEYIIWPAKEHNNVTVLNPAAVLIMEAGDYLVFNWAAGGVSAGATADAIIMKVLEL